MAQRSTGEMQENRVSGAEIYEIMIREEKKLNAETRRRYECRGVQERWNCRGV